MKYNMCNINESSNANHIAISLKGNWYKCQDGFVRITILKDLMIVSSNVSTKEENIDIELPVTKQFFLTVKSIDGDTNVLINGRIRMNLAPGKQLFGTVNL